MHPDYTPSLPASGSASPHKYISRYSSAGMGGQALLQLMAPTTDAPAAWGSAVLLAPRAAATGRPHCQPLHPAPPADPLLSSSGAFPSLGALQSASSSHHRRDYSLGGPLDFAMQEDAVLVALKEGMRSVVAGPADRQLSVVQVADVDLDDDEQVGACPAAAAGWRCCPMAGNRSTRQVPSQLPSTQPPLGASLSTAPPLWPRPQLTCCGRLYTLVFENRGARALFRLRDRVLRTTLAAMVYDILDVLLYIFDMYTDIKVGSDAGGPIGMLAVAGCWRLRAGGCLQGAGRCGKQQRLEGLARRRSWPRLPTTARPGGWACPSASSPSTSCSWRCWWWHTCAASQVSGAQQSGCPCQLQCTTRQRQEPPAASCCRPAGLVAQRR
jgi:hypothetical protein